MRRFLYLLAIACCLGAHGGVLLLHERAGAYLISLFSADAPLRAGSQDFTVLVQTAADGNIVSDCRVELSFRRANTAQVRIDAQVGQSANKLLYAAPAQLGAGVWQFTISVQPSGGAFAEAHGTVTILPEQPPIAAYWPYFAVPPIAVLLFTLNRWLKRRSKSTSRKIFMG
ncbi:MAG TPA: hypothetical protein VHZ07_02080 [Bryobacteraceae bacterium]|nr:hypothetical protein [Bryobacteraceae bacterium]